jgi:predicted dehydrogenase
MVLRLGLIGRGRWSANIERTLQTFPDVSVIVVARGETAPSNLDAVIIATQSATHAEIAIPYIEAGISTFIEKPMATSIVDAERMRDAAKRSGAVVFVGHIYLHHPAFRTALKLLPSLGPIRHVLCEGMNNHPRTDSSVLWDWLPHHLSMGRSVLARDPDSVSAWSLSDSSIPQIAVSKFQYGSTPLVSMVSWLSPVPRMQMTIACEDGTLIIDDKAERQLTLYGGRGDVSNPAYSGELPLTQEMSAFLRSVRSGAADPDQLEMGCIVVRSIAAAHDAIDLGGHSVKI